VNPFSYSRPTMGILLVLGLTLLAPTDAFAQASPIQAPPDQTIPADPNEDKKAPQDLTTDRAGRNNFFKNLFRDQKAFLKSPLSLKRSDIKWLAPLAGATALLIATDQRVANHIGQSNDPLRHSDTISSLGSPYATFGAAGTMFAIGALSDNERLKETGVMGFEALIDSAIVGRALKLATGRQRPGRKSSDGGFWSRGDSLPSGHAITTFALATVVAHQYSDKPLVQVAAYGIAAAVSVARVTGHSHYPSDALVGASLGFLIGRYVVRARGKEEGRRMPSISPYVSHATRTYGAGVSFAF
jgi:membrane-associated phospholipid phosphatase